MGIYIALAPGRPGSAETPHPVVQRIPASRLGSISDLVVHIALANAGSEAIWEEAREPRSRKLGATLPDFVRAPHRVGMKLVSLSMPYSHASNVAAAPMSESKEWRWLPELSTSRGSTREI
jgi:hypothetical protein